MQVETARFRPDDPDALVAATFACPGCLHADLDVALSVDSGGDDARASCSCRLCATRWSVWLDQWQAVRMTLSPPADHTAWWHLRVRAVRPA